MHQCATIIMKILTMVPVNVNSQGLNEVVKSLKRYRNIESTSNCPEKECEEVKKYANHTVKVLKNNCDSKDIRRKENKAAKKLLKPNNGLSTKEPVSENIKKVNAAPKRCLIETPANSESKKASNSKPPPPKKKVLYLIQAFLMISLEDKRLLCQSRNDQLRSQLALSNLHQSLINKKLLLLRLTKISMMLYRQMMKPRKKRSKCPPMAKMAN